MGLNCGYFDATIPAKKPPKTLTNNVAIEKPITGKIQIPSK